MGVPTEPGWYWWAHPTLASCIPVLCGLGYGRCIADGVIREGVSCFIYDGKCFIPFPWAQDGGEWGPRIPGPGRLEAMNLLVQRAPLVVFVHDETEGSYPLRYERTACGYCGRENHKPDCPWLLAQEKTDG